MRFTAAFTLEGAWYVAQCLEIDVASQGRSVEDALERAQGIETALGFLAQAARADAGAGRDVEVALAREAARERVERGYSGCHSNGGATWAFTVSITWS